MIICNWFHVQLSSKMRLYTSHFARSTIVWYEEFFSQNGLNPLTSIWEISDWSSWNIKNIMRMIWKALLCFIQCWLHYQLNIHRWRFTHFVKKNSSYFAWAYSTFKYLSNLDERVSCHTLEESSFFFRTPRPNRVKYHRNII